MDDAFNTWTTIGFLIVGVLGLIQVWGIWRASQLAKTLETMWGKIDGIREGLNDFKVEVARSYLTIEAGGSMERRLTEHLVRIEAKLDVRSAA